ncbi:MAG: beta strand repeat-containing protein, partial [Planctomycetaceae bacterium]
MSTTPNPGLQAPNYERPRRRSRAALRRAARLRSLKRAIRRRARRIAAHGTRAAEWLALAATAISPARQVQAQMGQMGMSPTGGVINNAVMGLSNLNQYGPGYLYYGLNFADRGLGYNGSYMTLGGFIPYAEDDLGGFWSADLRGHLSEYGGFFSNLGLVRKQFVGGSVLGVGVYWDYDGDQNQYPVAGMDGIYDFGQFGHAYNQVGVSLEFLTDYGNIRSNGYMPVGTTGYTAGNPGVQYFRNFLMCDYGLDAALSGVDLEVGAYIPGLTDWAGMVSVGGYALGNARYDWTAGPLDGEDIVPWFGGVYTRLDLTLKENWDFSIQANNDSFFDWTGFARLTYRMGGSRRRSVPDQIEQPMMRNEHIVRAHQTPITAGNLDDGGRNWYVIHVDNTAPDGGDGSFERPFNTLAEGNAAARFNWDVVLVHVGNGTATGYNTTFTPQPGAFNQFLIGDGRSFVINTTCGLIDLATFDGDSAPLLSNPTGTSINLQEGLVVNNFTIQNSAIAIGTLPGADLTGLPRPNTLSPFGPTTQSDWAAGASMVGNVVMDGQNNASRQGVVLDDSTGRVNFWNTSIRGMTDGAFVVDGGDPNVTFQGSIQNDASTGYAVEVRDTTGGTVNIAVGGTPIGATVSNTVVDDGGLGILVDDVDGTVNIGNAKLSDNPTAVTVTDSIGFFTLTDSTITHSDGSGSAVAATGGKPNVTIGPSNTIDNTGGRLLLVKNSNGGTVALQGATLGAISDQGGTGILIEQSASNVGVFNAEIDSSADGIRVQESTGFINAFSNVLITGAGGTAGVYLLDNTAGGVALTNVDITTNGAVGLLVEGDPTDPFSFSVGGGSTINTTGQAAISINGLGSMSVNFDSVASTGSSQHGISVTNSKTGGAGIQIGTTTVSNATSNGINLVNNEPRGNGAGTLFRSTVTTLTDTGAGGLSGIFVQNTNARFTGATITGWTNSVTATSPNASDESIIFVSQSTLTGASAAAVNLQAGQGTVNATFLDNTIATAAAAGPSVQAIVGNTAGSLLNIDLSGNSIAPATIPANAVQLTNSATGTLGVSQTATAPATIQQVISAANNSPSTVIVTPT